MNINNVKVMGKGKVLDGKIRIQNKKNKKKINFKIYKYSYLLLISLFFIYVKIGLIEYCKNLASNNLILKTISKGDNSTIQKENLDFNNISKIKDFIYFKKIIEIKNEEYENKNLTIETIQNKLGQINSINYINEEYIDSDLFKISKDINITEISLFFDNYRSFPLNENNISNFTICQNPNISIIIPTYNSQDELIYLHKSIQAQFFENIEIIYIDNKSTDDTTKIIENLQKRDKRIILLKNKGNKGPFYSRNKGALFSRGEYIQFIDSDDLIFGNILEISYKIAKYYDLDIVQYQFISKFRNRYDIYRENIKKNKIIYQPELRDHMYYGKGRLSQSNFFIFNKIIKKEIFLKALIYMGEEILNENLFFNEDLLQLFSVLRVANSFLYINDIGYAKLDKIKKGKSLFESRYNPKFSNKILHNNFIEVRFIYEKTSNNKHEKSICCQFLKMTNYCYSSIFNKVTQGFELFDEVFKLLLNSEYLSRAQKANLVSLRRKIMYNSQLKKNKCEGKKFNY